MAASVFAGLRNALCHGKIRFCDSFAPFEAVYRRLVLNRKVREMPNSPERIVASLRVAGDIEHEILTERLHKQNLLWKSKIAFLSTVVTVLATILVYAGELPSDLPVLILIELRFIVIEGLLPAIPNVFQNRVAKEARLVPGSENLSETELLDLRWRIHRDARIRSDNAISLEANRYKIWLICARIAMLLCIMLLIIHFVILSKGASDGGQDSPSCLTTATVLFWEAEEPAYEALVEGVSGIELFDITKCFA